MTEHIEHRLEDGITYITINDPKNGNRVSDPMAEELSLQIDAASETSKAVVLRTMGGDFCLGFYHGRKTRQIAGSLRDARKL